MNTTLVLPSYIIVLGTTYSGSGAVWDYLAGRGDLYDPLCGEEYQLPQVPHGLMSLEAAAGHAFHPASADFAVTMFEDIVTRLARPNTKWSFGKDYSQKIPSFNSAIKNFLDEIVVAHLPMHLDWHRLMQSPTNRFMFRLANWFGISNFPRMTRLLVSSRELVSAAQSMHDKLMKSCANGQPVILNQAGSGWNPIESTKYFRHRKVVLVSRDPRDQFAEMKKYKKASCVNGFIEWYLQMQRRLAQIEDPRLIKITFEDFVRNNENAKKKLVEHLIINKDFTSSYEAENSLSNIGKYRTSLSSREVGLINEKLSVFCAKE